MPNPHAWVILGERLVDDTPHVRVSLADVETPVSAYLKVARGAPSFLLESVEGGERLARYSIVGTEPRQQLEVRPGRARLTGPDDVDERPCDDPLALVDETPLRQFVPVDQGTVIRRGEVPGEVVLRPAGLHGGAEHLPGGQ